MKPGRVSRVLQILTALQSGARYGTNDLRKMFNVSKRTLFRDLKDLANAGVPYRYDPDNCIYEVSREFFLPPLGLSLKEARAILLLLYKVRNHLNFPFKKSALSATLKIESVLPAETKRFCSAILRNVSVRPEPEIVMGLLDKIFSQLLEAIANRWIVRVQYYSAHEENIETHISPYHLFYGDYAWNVVGKSSLHNGVRAFKLNRIKTLEPSGKCFIDGQDFDIHQYLGRAWSMEPEGRIYNIKLRFLPEKADEVAGVQWHSTQRVKRNDDGSATIQFRVDGLGEITWWILGFGDKVQVLAPAVLKKRIASIAKNIVKNNTHLLVKP